MILLTNALRVVVKIHLILYIKHSFYTFFQKIKVKLYTYIQKV